jgi:hypothetical protein
MCEVRRASDGRNTLPILYQSVLMCCTSEPRNQESGSAICKKYQMSHRGGHTHARDKIERMATNQIHCRSMSNIKSSREQYTAELHLEIRKIYIGSIYLSEAVLAWWLYFRARATTSKSSNSGRSAI